MNQEWIDDIRSKVTQNEQMTLGQNESKNN